jgi:peptidyl-prolyl cis-trans isomerase D
LRCGALPPKAAADAPAVPVRPDSKRKPMIQLFRRILTSKVGAIITLAFLALIAFAFAAGDVLNLGGSSKVQAGDEIAEVGSQKITAAEFENAMRTALENERQNNPQLTMQQFVSLGGAETVLGQLLDRNAILAFGREHGIIAGDRLIDSEIGQIPAAQGPDGRFSQLNYEGLLRQRGLTDKMVRDDFAASLVARQVLVPASFGASFPQEATLRYAALLREHRKGALALLPSAIFAPTTPPSDAEVTAFYNKTRDDYMLPERRIVRYALFDAGIVKDVAAPTEAEVAARYNANKAQYAASETRRITQLIAPTEAAARTILAETASGTTLEQAAKAKGLSAVGIAASKADLASQASQAVANAAYSAGTGVVVGPARSGLGWHLLRVDGIDRTAARSLDQVRAEITSQLAEQKRRQALSDFSARIEEEFDNGSALSDVAKELGVSPSVTQPVTADGQVFGKPGQTVPEELAKVVKAAFSMDRENQPQIAEIVPGTRFVMFDVTQITPAAPAPLAEIKAGVAQELMLEKGQIAAKAAADRVLAAMKAGTDLATAVGQLDKPLPAVDRIDMGREQLTAQGRQVPPPLALLFSMAQGTVKLYPAPRNRGWYIVSLSEIIPGKIAADDPMIAPARRELGQLAGREYAEQLRRAIRAEVGVTRKESAIKAAIAQAAGGS